MARYQEPYRGIETAGGPIDDLIAWHRERYTTLHKSRPLFPSRQGKRPQQMSRRTAHNVLKAAFIAAGLNGHLATHSLRKSFAQRLYEQSGDIFMVQELLGHANVATTQKYFGVNYASARQAVEVMAFSVDIHRRGLVSSFNSKFNPLHITSVPPKPFHAPPVERWQTPPSYT